MKTAYQVKRMLAGMTAVLFAFLMGAGITAVPVSAASGTVYTCTIHPCYSHPVTGEIEDSGGEASYATGQGMVEGCLYTTGILEVTDSGEYYLTIRLSLMDYTSGHSFWVQSVGDSGWSTPAMGVTGNGSDTNGTTADVCIQVPSENCVVRGSMYVTPMGRDVVFYLYPSDFSEGNQTDMNATMVTAASGSDAGQTAQNTEQNTQDTSSAAETQTPAASDLQSQASAQTDAAQTEEAAPTPTAAPTATPEASKESSDTKSVGKKLENSITMEATPEAENPETGETTALDKASGLSLSTETEEGNGTAEKTDSGTRTVGEEILINVISSSITGCILIGALAGVGYLFRRNWKRWGGGEDDDEY